MDHSTPKKTTRPCSDDSSSSDGNGEFSYKNFRPKKKRRSDAGRRYQKGILYCSSLGITCHFCRQKTTQKKVICRVCVLAFCGHCLQKRHGEVLEIELAEDNWLCPKCRGGCGPGCKNCCNCTFCRQKQGLKPPKISAVELRTHGFDNVHDYLIHLETGESPEKISSRKRGKGWCSSYERRHSTSERDSQFPKQKQKEDRKEHLDETKRRASSTLQGGIGAEHLEKSTRELDQNVDALKSESQRVRNTSQINNDGGNIERPMSAVGEQQFTSTGLRTHASKVADSFPEQFRSKNEYKEKLEAKLAEPFDGQELKELWDAITFRKPFCKLGDTHEEASSFPAKGLSYSYMHHHPDLAAKYTATGEAGVKLQLLRGFFFWLEHASMSGSFKPWKENGNIDEECLELKDLDFQVLGELVDVDKEQQTQKALQHGDEDIKPNIKPGFLETLPSQSKAVFNWDEEDIKPKVEDLTNWRSSTKVQAGRA